MAAHERVNRKRMVLDILKDSRDFANAVSLKEIVDRLKSCSVKTTRQTVKSDIEEFNLCGYEIESYVANKNHERFYWYAGSIFELSEITLLSHACCSSRFLPADMCKNINEKLSQILNKHDAVELRQRIFVPNRMSGKCYAIFDLIDRIFGAIGAKKNIRFIHYYIDIDKNKVPKHEGKIYEVCPIAVIFVNEWYYLIAHQIDENRLKFYRIDRMDNVSTCLGDKKIFKKYERYDPENCKIEHFNMFGGDIKKVSVEFNNSLAGVIIDRFGWKVRIKKIDSEHSMIEENIAVSEQFVGWLVGLGEKVKVTGPESVVDMIRTRIRKMVNMYGI